MRKYLVIALLLAPGLLAQSRNISIDDLELSTLRAITVTRKATFSDLCKIILIQKNELEKYRTDQERCARVAELGVYDTAKIDYVHLKPLSYGAAAKAMINAHGIQKTLMFRLTRTEWYALQNAEAEGLIPPGSNAWDTISGEDLVTIMDEALAHAAERESWMKEKNPYGEFGFETYREMEENARKGAAAPTKDKK